MDDANKILDVTYGSFSCRLEGFEDSVETMKTVVMYFHDLAGHDRFMDMEPQAPDMDELARLTEEQSGVAVEVEGAGQQVSLMAGAALAAGLDDDDADLAAELETLSDESWDDTADNADVAAQDDAEDEDIDAIDEDAVADLDEMDDDASEEAPEETAMLAEDDVEESVAEKLRRIRDVVDQSPAADEAEDAVAATDTEMDDDRPKSNPLAAGLSALAQRTSEARFVDDMPPADDLTEEMDAAIAETEDAVADATEDMADTAAQMAEDSGDLVEDEVADILAEQDMPAEDDAPQEAAYDDVAEDMPDDAMDDAGALAAEAAQVEDAAQAAPESGPLVLTSHDAASDEDAAAADDDEDFDLQAEVAKVEAELAARKGNSMARHGLPRSVDDAMSRILSQTDQHLNQPESRRHRDAFAQLKAAVAATEAARQLGDDGAPVQDPDEAYKDDLGAHDAQERADADAETPKAPPLKLVKTQIIDDPAQAPATAPAASTSKPVDAASMRLREIAARKETAEPVNAMGFKEFAESQGAVEVIDMIEAAAAYLYCVEGDADFSRPQVMKKVQTATGKEISREDGLRAFGRLLRLAKIVKLNNGRFRISETSEYRPDNAQAAQG